MVKVGRNTQVTNTFTLHRSLRPITEALDVRRVIQITDANQAFEGSEMLRFVLELFPVKFGKISETTRHNIINKLH